MKRRLRKRRWRMLDIFNRTGSVKKTIEIICKEFGVKKETAEKDWKRRPSWMEDIIDLTNSNDLILGCLYDVQHYSKELERFAKTTKSPSCRLGAINRLIESRFKLVKFYHSYQNGEVRERIEKLEKRLDELLESQKEDSEVKKR